MSPKLLTNLFLLVWIAVAIGYDLWVYARYGREATITHTLAQWVEDFPILLIALGCLLWHLWGKGK
jgi:hypothetical protein